MGYFQDFGEWQFDRIFEIEEDNCLGVVSFQVSLQQEKKGVGINNGVVRLQDLARLIPETP